MARATMVNNISSPAKLKKSWKQGLQKYQTKGMDQSHEKTEKVLSLQTGRRNWTPLDTPVTMKLCDFLNMKILKLWKQLQMHMVVATLLWSKFQKAFQTELQESYNDRTFRIEQQDHIATTNTSSTSRSCIDKNIEARNLGWLGTSSAGWQ